MKNTEQQTSRKRKRTTLYEKHIPCAVGFYIVPSAEDFFKCRYETYTGEDVVKWFLTRILQIKEELFAILHDEKRLKMTPDDWRIFNASRTCSICQKPFDTRFILDKVRDHDHLTGKFRGAAHAQCNLQLQQAYRISIFIHNFRGYDGHLIAFATQYFPNIKINVLGQGFEKYLTLGFSRGITFKDSYQFLSYSLDQLGRDLLKSGQDKFAHLLKQHPNISNECFSLLLRKGVFPYEFLDARPKAWFSRWMYKVQGQSPKSKILFFDHVMEFVLTFCGTRDLNSLWW